MKRFAAIALLLLTACSSATKDYTPQAISFANQPVIKVNVAEIHVINAYQPPLMAPNVEQDFPTPPARAVEQWVKERLQAAGTAGVLEVSIDDASVKETPLKVKDSLGNFFGDPQTSQFDATLKVSFHLYNGVDALAVANAEANVSRGHSIGKKASVADRERVFDLMTTDLMTGFNSEAELRLRQFMTPYLVP